ncbi:MAG: hypothetical protein HOW97_09205 [Catenulispora sp.]|nr:hypothetical protein [Catenulispora sp.]
MTFLLTIRSGSSPPDHGPPSIAPPQGCGDFASVRHSGEVARGRGTPGRMAADHLGNLPVTSGNFLANEL